MKIPWKIISKKLLEVWELLSLIKCEFIKLKRKKIIYLIFISAILFPLAIALLLTQDVSTYSPAELYNELYINSIGFGIQFLLPVILSILATILFFTERDNDTFKALRTIPVTSRQLVLAKILFIFLISIFFVLATHFMSMILGTIFFTFNDSLDFILITLGNGIFITAGTLPLIILNVTFSRTYIFSVLLTVFYTILSFFLIPLNPYLPKIVFQLVPITTTTFWTAGVLGKIGKVNLEIYDTNLRAAIPSTLNISVYMALIGIASIIIMVKLYERWEG